MPPFSGDGTAVVSRLLEHPRLGRPESGDCTCCSRFVACSEVAMERQARLIASVSARTRKRAPCTGPPRSGHIPRPRAQPQAPTLSAPSSSFPQLLRSTVINVSRYSAVRQGCLELEAMWVWRMDALSDLERFVMKMSRQMGPPFTYSSYRCGSICRVVGDSPGVAAHPLLGDSHVRCSSSSTARCC